MPFETLPPRRHWDLTVVFDNVCTGRQSREKGVFVMSWQGLNQRHRFRAHGSILIGETHDCLSHDMLARRRQRECVEKGVSGEGGSAQEGVTLKKTVNVFESCVRIVAVGKCRRATPSPLKSPYCAGRDKTRSSHPLYGSGFPRHPPPSTPHCTTDHGEPCMADLSGRQR